jgi:glycerate kinase
MRPAVVPAPTRRSVTTNRPTSLRRRRDTAGPRSADLVRVVIAPDCFTGTLDAVAAAQALAAGWTDIAPGDSLEVVPMSDGGPGFLDALLPTLGGEPTAIEVSDPLGRPVEAQVLVSGRTAWVESAQACGLGRLSPAGRDPRRTTTTGVGQLLAHVATLGVDRCIVGLGGSGTNDGGAGAWAALGAEPAAALAAGGAALADLDAGRLRPPGTPAYRLVLATDVDIPLLGPSGASAMFGPQKGADAAAVAELEAALTRWADAVEPAVGRAGLRRAPGAGAAGGLGFGLLALGGERVVGAAAVADELGLAGRIASADVVVTGEGHLDVGSLRGKVVSAVARLAQEAGVPCVVVAGQVSVGDRQSASRGIDATYAVRDLAGSAEAAIASGAVGVQAAARLVARDWSPGAVRR